MDAYQGSNISQLMGTLTVNIKKPKPNFAKKAGNIVGKYFHIHLNTDGFQGCFHLEFFYTFQVLGSIPSFNYTS